MKDATEEQIAVNNSKRNKSPLSDSKNRASPLQQQNTTASDDTSMQQESECGKEPQRTCEREASEQKEVATHDSKEHQDSDGEKMHDSGRLVASEPKEGEQPVLEMQTVKEQISEPEQKENWPNDRESEEREMTESSVQHVADGGNVDSEQMSRKQAASDGEQSLKIDESAQHVHGDAVGENRVADKTAIKPKLTEEQRAMCRL